MPFTSDAQFGPDSFKQRSFEAQMKDDINVAGKETSVRVRESLSTLQTMQPSTVKSVNLRTAKLAEEQPPVTFTSTKWPRRKPQRRYLQSFKCFRSPFHRLSRGHLVVLLFSFAIPYFIVRNAEERGMIRDEKVNNTYLGYFVECKRLKGI